MNLYHLSLDPVFIGNNIRVLRLSRGLSIKEFANICKINPTKISHYESGLYLPSLTNLVRLAEGLQCGTQYIIYGKDYDPGLDLGGLTNAQKYALYAIAREFRQLNYKIQDLGLRSKQLVKDM